LFTVKSTWSRVRTPENDLTMPFMASCPSCAIRRPSISTNFAQGHKRSPLENPADRCEVRYPSFILLCILLWLRLLPVLSSSPHDLDRWSPILRRIHAVAPW